MPERDMTPLIDAWLDGTIAPGDAVALERWIESDRAHALRFSEHAMLARHLVERSRTQSASATAAEPSGTCASVPTTGRRIPVAWSLAAAILLALGGVAIYLVAFASESSESAPTRSMTPVATLVDVTGGGTLIVDNDVAYPGSDIPARAISMASGAAELQMVSGANVKIMGSSSLDIHDPMTLTVHRGRARFDCPPSAVGLTVRLPHGGEVVDLGTAFEVIVHDDSVSTVSVSDGAVRVMSTDDSGAVAGMLVEAGTSCLLVDGRFEDRSALPPVDAIAHWWFDGDAPAELEQIGEIEAGVGGVRLAGGRLVLDAAATADRIGPIGDAITLEAVFRIDGASEGRRSPLIEIKPIGSSDDQTTLRINAQAGNTSRSPRLHYIGVCLGDGHEAHFVFSDLAVRDDDWHHLAVTIDPAADVVRITLDGRTESLACPVDALLPPAGPLVIGGHSDQSGRFSTTFRGQIAEVRIVRGPIADYQHLKPELGPAFKK